MLSKEDYEYLLSYERTFYTAAKQAYARILPRTVNEKLAKIANREVKNMGCGACVMSLYRSLYNLLEEEKARRQANKEKMEKVREAKNKNKENKTQEENGRKTTEPEQLDK